MFSVFSVLAGPKRQLEHRMAVQAVGIAAVLAAGGDHQQAEAQHVGDAVPHALRQARFIDAGGQALGDAEPLLDLAQHQHARVGGQLPTIEAGDDGLAGDRCRAGQRRRSFNLGGHGPGGGWFQAWLPNPITVQGLTPCPRALVHNSG